ncbi:Pycsar system effector family protein [Paenibacillus sp. WLX2291]|uniref:Pycsar system effector family protein n=1 Tax=Paenibacillus sp. WLX2291 TaxID=3296934 RepID=UPI0039842A7F
MHRIEFSKHEMNYLSDYIKFADAKAGVIIGINALLIKEVFSKFQPKQLYTLQDFLGLLGVMVLLIGICFLISVVLPRTNFKASKGIIFWDNIKKYDSPSDYISDIIALDELKLSEKLAEQNFYLAKTASRKYLFLVIGFWVSTVGALFSSCWFCFSYFI